MKSRGYLVPAATMLFTLLAPGVTRSMDRTGPTVGDFLARVAVLTGEQQRERSGTADATKVFDLTADLERSTPLTYGAISRIAADLGIRVTTPAVPAGPVSAER